MRTYLFFAAICVCQAASAQTLQSVTNSGSTTTNPMSIIANTTGDLIFTVQNTDVTDATARAILMLSNGATGNGSLYVTNANNATSPSTFIVSSGAYLPGGLSLNTSAGDINATASGHINLHSGATMNGGLNSTQDRPAVSSGTITGEFRGVSDASTLYTADDGFLRLSAGGGTNANTKSYIDLSGYTSSGSAPDRYENITLGTSGTERMRILWNGDVGVGTTAPTTKLTVAQTGAATLNSSNSYLTLFAQGGSALGLGGTGSVSALQSWNSQPLALNPIGNNVLIGKSSQTNTAYMLDVAGGVRANGVTVNTTGADFVFAPGYALPSLQSVAAYVDAHHHLQGIPSAAQMQADGVDLGEMQRLHLQKIEELTLYAIEANKRIAALEAELKALQDRLKAAGL